MLVSCLLELYLIDDFFIRPVWNTETGEDITECKTSELIEGFNFSIFVCVQVIEDSVETLTKWCPGNILDGIEHPHPILVVDESVTEDSRGLMGPQSEARVWSHQLLVRWHRHSADNLRNVSQVKRVVRLKGRWLQVSLDVRVDL